MSETVPHVGAGGDLPKVTAADPVARPMAGTYAAVLLFEAVVLVALWGFSRYFGP